mmetsp:Transcript_35804/g.74473  ORF Transcript_35804/g.74473 Transcript_35804/m.74473 type:complete len:810 (-) Transcript_35804:1152-3581(-)
MGHHYHNPNHLAHHHHHNHHLSSAPTIKNHSVTHFGGYLYCFGGYDGRRNHMTLLIYSIADQRWIRPVMTNTTPAAAGAPGMPGGPSHGGMASSPNGSSMGGPGADPYPQQPGAMMHDLQYPGAYQHPQQAPPQQQQPQQQGGVEPVQQQQDAAAQPLHYHHNPNNDLHGQAGMGMADGAADNILEPPYAGDIVVNNVNNNNPNANNLLHHQQQQHNNVFSSSSASSPIWVTGTPPPGRNGHSATLVTDDDDDDADENHPESGRIIVLGGWLGTGPLAASDMHVLDISNGGRQLRWYQPAIKGTPPGPCNMHSADYVKARRAVYVFRGGNGREYLNDLHALCVDTMQWNRVETTGAIPQQRANHSSAILGEELFIFGGWNGTERLNDIHVLDTKTRTWTCPHVGGVLPHPRAGMTLTALRGRLYLFGGSGTSAKCFQDLQILDREQMAWLDVSTEQEVQKLSATGGGRYEEDVVPSSRYHPHAYYGGSAQQPQYDPDGVPYHHNNPYGVVGMEEEQPRFHASSAIRDGTGNRSDWRHRARQQHHAASISNPNDEDSVPSVLIQGRGPGRRAGHTATAVNRKIYVFGGSCGSDYLNDFFVLDTDPPPRAVVTEPNSLELMETRLSHFFNDEEFADVVFLVQGQRVYGHKMVLSVVSDCFRAMFSAGFRESSSHYTLITIPDCSHSSFLAVMEYIYTGKLPKGLVESNATPGRDALTASPSSDTASSQHSTGGGTTATNSSGSIDTLQLSRLVELLELADRFFLDHLKQVCETFLQSQVSAETVEYLSSVAQKTNAAQLHDICQHYLRNRE